MSDRVETKRASLKGGGNQSPFGLAGETLDEFPATAVDDGKRKKIIPLRINPIEKFSNSIITDFSFYEGSPEKEGGSFKFKNSSVHKKEVSQLSTIAGNKEREENSVLSRPVTDLEPPP